MAKPFSELRKKMSPAAQRQSKKMAEKLLQKIALSELRRAKELSQEELSKRLHVEQPHVSRLEKRTDMYISTLRKYVEAVGGHLEIIARFPDGAVRINQFEKI